MRYMVAALFLLASAPAAAGWVKYGENDEATFYVDPRVRVDGELRTVWQLEDLKRRDSSGVMSRRSLQEFDCKTKRGRVLSASFHSELSVKGSVLGSSETPGEWHDVAPGSVAEAILRKVCALRR